MDAYVFITTATATAVSTLGAGAGSTGPARVVLPVTGSHALFVAVEATTDADLNDGVTGVTGSAGISGVSTFLAANVGVTFPMPVHSTVDSYLGLALLDTVPGLSVVVRDAATAIDGVTGAAVVAGAGYSVLVEVTAADADSVALLLNQVAGLTGVRAVATSVGATALGFGLTTS
jgi:hypothetical protein